jgi:phage terminase large subunit GpA-like protein
VRTRFVRGHPVRYWFKPSGKRNEALDRRVYALAALHSRPVPWEVLLRAAPTEPPHYRPRAAVRPRRLLHHRCPRWRAFSTGAGYASE